MNKIMNFLVATVIAFLVVIAPAASYAAEQSDEELIEEYDKLFDQWVSEGLSSDEIIEKGSDWADEKKIKHNSVLKHMDQKEDQLNQMGR